VSGKALSGKVGTGFPFESATETRLRKDYWKKTPLDKMTPAEWEALCDGCGKCCLLKFEDEDDGELTYPRIACRLFDDMTCTCMNYPLRNTLVAGCIVLTPETLPTTQQWLPKTCAYRLLAEGKPLADWHPLISGTKESVHAAGISMLNATVPEYEVDEDDWTDHAIDEEV